VIRSWPKLLVITDRHQAHFPLDRLGADIIAAGAPWVLLRDKDLDRLTRRLTAEALKRASDAAGARLSVGGDVELAHALGLGVHLSTLSEVSDARRRLGPDALIGFSAHQTGEIGPARTAGADYVTLSPIFASASKPGYGPTLGLGALTTAAAIGMPVYGLGGLSAANAAACLEAGATGIAVMGEIMRATDPGARVAAIVSALAETA
jgi:thiamine-phosphate pyrophosphorylase